MKTKQTTLILPEQLLKDFKEYANSQAKSVTAIIRELMEKELRKVNK